MYNSVSPNILEEKSLNLFAEYRNGQSEHYNIYGNGLIGKLVPTAKAVTVSQTVLGQTITAKDTVYIVAGGRINSESMVAAVGNGSTSDKRYYYLVDHLGSIRVVLTETGGVDSWSDFYPHGKEARSGSSGNKPKEQFTGKERDAETTLDYFGARYYNADIVRWLSVDPLKEKHPDWNPYNYVLGNPLVLIDPDGKQVYLNYAGNYVGTFGNSSEYRLTSVPTKESFNKLIESGNSELIYNSSKPIIMDEGAASDRLQQIKLATDVKTEEINDWIVLDNKSGVVSLEKQVSSDNSAHNSNNEYKTGYSYADQPYIVPVGNEGNKVIIGQVHGHREKDVRTSSGHSEPDKTAAKKTGVPFYGVGGVNIFKANPDGTTKILKKNIPILKDALDTKKD